MRMIRGGDGNHIPAMPVDPFEHRAHIQGVLLRSTFGRQNPHQRFDKSLLFRWEVNNVPLRPVVRAGMRQDYIDGLNRRADSLDNLHPIRLIDINPGENVGFARVMKQLSDENNWDDKLDEPSCNKYTAMFMDCDLFDKCVKVRTCCNTPFILAVARTMTKSPSIMCVIVTDDVRRLRRRQELPHALRGFPGLVAHLQTCCPEDLGGLRYDDLGTAVSPSVPGRYFLPENEEVGPSARYVSGMHGCLQRGLRGSSRGRP